MGDTEDDAFAAFFAEFEQTLYLRKELDTLMNEGFYNLACGRYGMTDLTSADWVPSVQATSFVEVSSVLNAPELLFKSGSEVYQPGEQVEVDEENFEVPPAEFEDRDIKFKHPLGLCLVPQPVVHATRDFTRALEKLVLIANCTIKMNLLAQQREDSHPQRVDEAHEET
eukprot:GILJ01005108.1.p1 GENE.GILJ01005108.1~~GILJ01005108.1.p1  ORF type:complete len:169 (+),score=24.19 GILJ01005108.1:38-544(+)